MKSIQPILYRLLLPTLILLLGSCKKQTEVPHADDAFFVQFLSGSDTVRYQDGENNYGNGPGVSSFADAQGRSYSEHTTFIRSALSPDYEHSVLTLQMVRFWPDTAMPDYNTAFLLFDEGDYDFGSWSPDSTELNTDGAVVTYTDQDGKVWSSGTGFGTQPETSFFNISLHRAIDEPQFGAQTYGTFQCRVFDGLGSHLDLGQGSFHARTILNP